MPLGVEICLAAADVDPKVGPKGTGAREAAPLRLSGSAMAIVTTAGWIGMGLGGYQAGFFYDVSASYLLSYANGTIAGILNLLVVAALFCYRRHRMVRRAIPIESA